jgi:hypothetical protein
MPFSYECRVLSLRRADHSFRGLLPCVHVSHCDRAASTMRKPRLTGLSNREKKKHNTRCCIANQDMSVEFSSCMSEDRCTYVKGVVVCGNVCKIEQQKNVCY